MAFQTVLGQPSLRIATDQVEAWITQLGAHVGPITFRIGNRNICPMHVAPWAEESWAIFQDEDLEDGAPGTFTPSTRVLRGDFFCMPFGGNNVPFEGEQYTLHGETPNRLWTLDRRSDNEATFSLETQVRAGHVTKRIHLVDGHSVIYSRITIAEMSGPMTVAHHAMLHCQTEGLVSVAPFKFGQTFPTNFESPNQRGYSYLAAGATFDDLDKVPARDGRTADLSRYPARRGYEDFAMMFAADNVHLGWSAVVFPEEDYVWFSLKNPKVLTGTAFWMTNGGRHYDPWNGRHVNVLGIEETTSSVGTGLADSLGNNSAAQAGCKTILQLDPYHPTVINTLFGIAGVPDGFDHVAEICAEGDGVSIKSRSGLSIHVPVDLGHLQLESVTSA